MNKKAEKSAAKEGGTVDVSTEAEVRQEVAGTVAKKLSSYQDVDGIDGGIILMTKKEKLLSLQMKRLLSSLSDHGTLHLTEVETDLVQTSFLLNEAIEKLSTSFMAIHEAVCTQQAIVDALLEHSASSPDTTEKLKAAQAEVGLRVNSAVTSLQFQDMTSQLIGRTVRRVNGLRDVLAAVNVSSGDMTHESDTKEMTALLNDLNRALDDQSAKLESVLWKAVSQTHMESGDIELF